MYLGLSGFWLATVMMVVSLGGALLIDAWIKFTVNRGIDSFLVTIGPLVLIMWLILIGIHS